MPDNENRYERIFCAVLTAKLSGVKVQADYHLDMILRDSLDIATKAEEKFLYELSMRKMRESRKEQGNL